MVFTFAQTWNAGSDPEVFDAGFVEFDSVVRSQCEMLILPIPNYEGVWVWASLQREHVACRQEAAVSQSQAIVDIHDKPTIQAGAVSDVHLVSLRFDFNGETMDAGGVKS